MKVGIDARLLSRTITGMGRYTLEMCLALSRVPEISLYIYSPSTIDQKIVESLALAKIRTTAFKSVFLRQIWSESYLPFWVYQDEIDVFWGPAHRLPRHLPDNVARVVTIHDLVWKYYPETMRPLYRLLEKIQMPPAIRSADCIATDSIATADAVQKEFSVISDRIEVVSLGVSQKKKPESLAPLHSYGIDRPFILTVGTLEPRKNIERLLRAYSCLEAGLKDNNLLVIAGGSGWGDVSVPELIIEFYLEKHVIMLGYVDDEILELLYCSAQFLAMPSLYEGFGLPLIEAMSHGTPVLTSNNSSMKEIGEAGGLLVDPLDINSIREAMSRLLSDSKLRDSLSSMAKTAASEYGWEISAKKMFELFERAISMRKGIK